MIEGSKKVLSKPLRVGFLGGTFDPLHFGHLHLAIELMERCRLDEVVFSPAFLSPFKLCSPPRASIEARLEMLRLGMAPFPFFTVWADATKLSKEKPFLAPTLEPSFTIDSLRTLHTQRPGVEWHLLLGEDALPGLHQWKDIEELVALAPPLVGNRQQTRFFLDAQAPAFLRAALAQSRVDIPVIEVNGTSIRERLALQKTCAHLIPSPVLDYIKLHQLYRVH